jgi:hypothetical protein
MATCSCPRSLEPQKTSNSCCRWIVSEGLVMLAARRSPCDRSGTANPNAPVGSLRAEAFAFRAGPLVTRRVVRGMFWRTFNTFEF